MPYFHTLQHLAPFGSVAKPFAVTWLNLANKFPSRLPSRDSMYHGPHPYLTYNSPTLTSQFSLLPLHVVPWQFIIRAQTVGISSRSESKHSLDKIKSENTQVLPESTLDSWTANS